MTCAARARGARIYASIDGYGFENKYNLFIPFVPTPNHIVDRMLELAEIGKDDLVLDMGSGDGRIVIQAAMTNPGVRGVGIEIDESLIPKSEENAKLGGVADRVKFLHQNVFDADLSSATVITMWLFPELMRLLRPKILREARPGTRIITRTWNLGSWTPDETFKNGSNEVYKYIVPADVTGNWYWDLPIGGRTVRYSSVMEQQFQKAEGAVRVGKRRDLFENTLLAAYLRAGRGDQAAALLARRLDRQPSAPVARPA